MSLLTLSNPSVSNVWNVVLDEHSEVENDLPLTFFNIKNGSSLTLIVHLNGSRAGIVEAYSMDTYIGKQFETFTVSSKDGDNLAIDDVFVQVGNNIQMTTSPYNPSWEMLEENIDIYASGCDSRISYSSTVDADTIKDTINMNPGLIVQRRLDVQGSASLGTYEIVFDAETILAGGAPINGEVLDTKQYKKIVEGGVFDYNVTNCSIKGWIIDYVKASDAMDICTVVVEPGESSNTYDNDNTTFGLIPDPFHATNIWTNHFEVSFPEQTITGVLTKFALKGDAGYEGSGQIQLLIDDVWTNVIQKTTTSTTYVEYSENDIAVRNKVTGMRVRTQTNSGAAHGVWMKLYEITLLYS